MNDNIPLHKAKERKNDEFYTPYETVERELDHYSDCFKGKIVYCNCDNENSNFVRYFLNKELSIKYLIYSGFTNGEGVSFDSSEAIETLKGADVIVTNPPFSLFRPYVSLLMKYEKKFLIIGHQNALKYKDIFPYIQNNKMWLGYGFPGYVGWFYSDYKDVAVSKQHKEGMVRVSGCCWYTNLKHPDRPKINLIKHYSPSDYPKYDEYNAINVDRTQNIPCDYDGVMGVPITFMHKYNPDQFEIIGLDRYVKDNPHYGHCFHIDGKEIYSRILIRRKQ